MKKSLFLFSCILLNFELFSQTNKGHFIISAEGNYNKGTQVNGIITDQNLTDGKYLNLGSSIGYFFTDRFIAGIGFDYSWSKEKVYNILLINKFVQYEFTDLKSNSFSPNFFLGYYWPVFNKVYFNTNLKIGYKRIQSKVNSNYGGRSAFDVSEIISLDPSSNLNYDKGLNTDTETNLFTASVCPEISYFITSKTGVYIGIGGINYMMNRFDTKTASWMINFNPSYWKFGLRLRL